jgi:hypothetical protein
MFQVWSIDKHLLRRLYSNQSGSKSDQRLRSEMFRLKETASTLISRTKVKPPKENSIKICLFGFLSKCQKSLRRNDWKFEVAQDRLSKEMDIERIIKGSRFVTNILRLLTTKRERRLAKMQTFMCVLPTDQPNDEH